MRTRPYKSCSTWSHLMLEPPAFDTTNTYSSASYIAFHQLLDSYNEKADFAYSVSASTPSDCSTQNSQVMSASVGEMIGPDNFPQGTPMNSSPALSGV